MSKHTPGPWEAPNIDDGCSARQYWIVGPDGEQLAAVVDDHSDPQADALLIAAAPDLLEALFAIRDARNTDQDLAAWALAELAMSKATGEPT